MTFKKRKRGGKREPKANLLTSNLTKTLTQYIQGKKYSPSTLAQLIQHLAIPPVHHNLLKQILTDLVSKGTLTLQKQKYTLPTSQPLVTGTIRMHSKGFGFVKWSGGSDIFIPKPFCLEAIDGDTVEVEISPNISPKGPEGQVVAILKRSRSHLACIILQKLKRHYVAFAPLLGADKPVKIYSKTALKEGDRIICKVKDWTEEEFIEAEMAKVIGNIVDPSVDIKAAVEEFELPDGFTVEAIEEAKSYGKKISAKEKEKRHDLSDLEIVTIDPETAKDFDDAISLTKDKKGHFFLGVHIADVSFYVKPGSHLDTDAFHRCNSVYFPGTCIPMLPEELSNELCSLKPKVTRLTQSIFAEFTPEGDLVNYSIERTCIKSQKRFSYKEALAVLEKQQKSPHLPLLQRMVELCHVLKKKRMERGSVDFSMPDSIVIIDEKGAPQRMERVEYDITHQMIEEFMLKANEIAAMHLSKQGKKLIFRVHEPPNPESFQDFVNFARLLGFSLPEQPTQSDIQKLFQEAKNSPLHSMLSIHFIRSMRLAIYSSEKLGHYGLALEYYCHFTSPIRRYTDLIIQRLLFNELPEDTDVDAIAATCSEKERIAFKAEQSVVILKKLRLAGTYFASEPSKVYEATITKIKPFAIFFEIPLFDLEGNVHVSELGNDYFEYNPSTMSFRGRRTGKLFQIGQSIFVKLDNINYILKQTQWSLEQPPATHKKRR